MKITEKYRPRDLSEVAAQKTAIALIENSIARSGLAGSSWWLSGATGTGKTTIAMILAEEFTQTEFTITEIVGRDVSVDDLREYERSMAFFPMGKGRCLVINEAQDLSDAAVSLLLSLVEKVNKSKHDMIVFTAMVDVLELKNDPMNRWRALTGRCNQVNLADTDSPVFRQEVVEYLEGVAASEGIHGADIQSLCEKSGWSIRATLNALDMQVRIPDTPVVDDIEDCPATRGVEFVVPRITIAGWVDPETATSEDERGKIIERNKEIFDSVLADTPAKPPVNSESGTVINPSRIMVAKNGYVVKDRATTFTISPLGGQWRLTLTNHATKSLKGGRKQKLFGSLEEIESAYKCLKGLAGFVSNQSN